jgi:uncharacterized membrane protein
MKEPLKKAILYTAYGIALIGSYYLLKEECEAGKTILLYLVTLAMVFFVKESD